MCVKASEHRGVAKGKLSCVLHVYVCGAPNPDPDLKTCFLLHCRGTPSSSGGMSQVCGDYHFCSLESKLRTQANNAPNTVNAAYD